MVCCSVASLWFCCVFLLFNLSAVYFYSVFNLYNSVWVWRGALGHTHPRLVLPTSDCPRGCCDPGTPVTGRGEGRGGQGRTAFARTLLRHTAVCVADTWGLLPQRTIQSSQIRPPKLWHSIYMHMNKLSPEVRIFKLVEQAGGQGVNLQEADPLWAFHSFSDAKCFQDYY